MVFFIFKDTRRHGSISLKNRTGKLHKTKSYRCTVVREAPLSVSSSLVHGLSISIQPLKALVSSVRSTAASGFPSLQTRSSDERPRLEGLLSGSGNSCSGHSQTLQSRKMHIPSSGQKGQSHHNLTYRTNYDQNQM